MALFSLLLREEGEEVGESDILSLVNFLIICSLQLYSFVILIFFMLLSEGSSFVFIELIILFLIVCLKYKKLSLLQTYYVYFNLLVCLWCLSSIFIRLHYSYRSTILSFTLGMAHLLTTLAYLFARYRFIILIQIILLIIFPFFDPIELGFSESITLLIFIHIVWIFEILFGKIVCKQDSIILSYLFMLTVPLIKLPYYLKYLMIVLLIVGRIYNIRENWAIVKENIKNILEGEPIISFPSHSKQNQRKKNEINVNKIILGDNESILSDVSVDESMSREGYTESSNGNKSSIGSDDRKPDISKDKDNGEGGIIQSLFKPKKNNDNLLDDKFENMLPDTNDNNSVRDSNRKHDRSLDGSSEGSGGNSPGKQLQERKNRFIADRLSNATIKTDKVGVFGKLKGQDSDKMTPFEQLKKTILEKTPFIGTNQEFNTDLPRDPEDGEIKIINLNKYFS